MTRTRGGLLLATLGIALGVASPSPARADDAGAEGYRFLGQLIASGIELLVPDARYELAGDDADDGWVLSFPIHLYHRGLSRDLSDDDSEYRGHVHLSLFVEPQIRVSGANQWRGLAGARLGLYPLWQNPEWFPGLVLEGGGLAGEDGNGGFGGIGLSWPTSHFYRVHSFSILFRRSYTDDSDPRSDVSVDFMVLLPD